MRTNTDEINPGQFVKYKAGKAKQARIKVGQVIRIVSNTLLSVRNKYGRSEYVRAEWIIEE